VIALETIGCIRNNLPSVCFGGNLNKLPPIASVYFVTNSRRVLYIGRSANLNKRWKKHHQFNRSLEWGADRISWLEVSDLSLLPETEYAMIKYFKPVLNGSRSGLNDVVANPNKVYRQSILQPPAKEITSPKLCKTDETMIPLEDVLSVRWTEEKRKNLQKARGRLSLAELSQRLISLNVSVSRQYLHRMEIDPDVKGVSFELIKALCAVLDVSLEEILCLDCQVNY
jgi:DNA-binding Xre family transcriptional regulator